MQTTPLVVFAIWNTKLSVTKRLCFFLFFFLQNYRMSSTDKLLLTIMHLSSFNMPAALWHDRWNKCRHLVQIKLFFYVLSAEADLDLVGVRAAWIIYTQVHGQTLKNVYRKLDWKRSSAKEHELLGQETCPKQKGPAVARVQQAAEENTVQPEGHQARAVTYISICFEIETKKYTTIQKTTKQKKKLWKGKKLRRYFSMLFSHSCVVTPLLLISSYLVIGYWANISNQKCWKKGLLLMA